MKIYSSTFLLALALLFPTFSQAAWEIEPDHTHVLFQVGHLGLTQTPGAFRKFQVQLNFDDEKIELSQVTLRINADSVSTVNDLRDKALCSQEWLDCASFPTITFASDHVRKLGIDNYAIDGILTIRGMSIATTFTVKLSNRTVNPWLHIPTVGFVGTAQIRRSSFGLNSFLSAISDIVDLEIRTELVKKP